MNPAISKCNLLLAVLCLLAVNRAAAVPPVEGTWLSGDGDGWIEITIRGNGLSGVITGSPTSGDDRPNMDEKNPDPALRSRPLTGLQLFAGFTWDGERRWTGGTIYDPNSGRTYRCIITWVDHDTLQVRGYVGVPILGRTESWKRLPD